MRRDAHDAFEYLLRTLGLQPYSFHARLNQSVSERARAQAQRYSRCANCHPHSMEVQLSVRANALCVRFYYEPFLCIFQP